MRALAPLVLLLVLAPSVLGVNEAGIFSSMRKAVLGSKSKPTAPLIEENVLAPTETTPVSAVEPDSLAEPKESTATEPSPSMEAVLGGVLDGSARATPTVAAKPSQGGIFSSLSQSATPTPDAPAPSSAGPDNVDLAVEVGPTATEPGVADLAEAQASKAATALCRFVINEFVPIIHDSALFATGGRLVTGQGKALLSSYKQLFAPANRSVELRPYLTIDEVLRRFNTYEDKDTRKLGLKGLLPKQLILLTYCGTSVANYLLPQLVVSSRVKIPMIEAIKEGTVILYAASKVKKVYSTVKESLKNGRANIKAGLAGIRRAAAEISHDLGLTSEAPPNPAQSSVLTTAEHVPAHAMLLRNVTLPFHPEAMDWLPSVEYAAAVQLVQELGAVGGFLPYALPTVLDPDLASHAATAPRMMVRTLRLDAEGYERLRQAMRPSACQTMIKKEPDLEQVAAVCTGVALPDGRDALRAWADIWVLNTNGDLPTPRKGLSSKQKKLLDEGRIRQGGEPPLMSNDASGMDYATQSLDELLNNQALAALLNEYVMDEKWNNARRMQLASKVANKLSRAGLETELQAHVQRLENAGLLYAEEQLPDRPPFVAHIPRSTACKTRFNSTSDANPPTFSWGFNHGDHGKHRTNAVHSLIADLLATGHKFRVVAQMQAANFLHKQVSFDAQLNFTEATRTKRMVDVVFPLLVESFARERGGDPVAANHGHLVFSIEGPIVRGRVILHAGTSDRGMHEGSIFHPWRMNMQSSWVGWTFTGESTVSDAAANMLSMAVSYAGLANLYTDLLQLSSGGYGVAQVCFTPALVMYLAMEEAVKRQFEGQEASWMRFAKQLVSEELSTFDMMFQPRFEVLSMGLAQATTRDMEQILTTFSPLVAHTTIAMLEDAIGEAETGSDRGKLHGLLFLVQQLTGMEWSSALSHGFSRALSDIETQTHHTSSPRTMCPRLRSILLSWPWAVGEAPLQSLESSLETICSVYIRACPKPSCCAVALCAGLRAKSSVKGERVAAAVEEMVNTKVTTATSIPVSEAFTRLQLDTSALGRLAPFVRASQAAAAEVEPEVLDGHLKSVLRNSKFSAGVYRSKFRLLSAPQEQKEKMEDQQHLIIDEVEYYVEGELQELSRPQSQDWVAVDPHTALVAAGAACGMDLRLGYASYLRPELERCPMSPAFVRAPLALHLSEDHEPRSFGSTIVGLAGVPMRSLPVRSAVPFAWDEEDHLPWLRLLNILFKGQQRPLNWGPVLSIVPFPDEEALRMAGGDINGALHRSWIGRTFNEIMQGTPVWPVTLDALRFKAVWEEEKKLSYPRAPLAEGEREKESGGEGVNREGRAFFRPMCAEADLASCSSPFRSAEYEVARLLEQSAAVYVEARRKHARPDLLRQHIVGANEVRQLCGLDGHAGTEREVTCMRMVQLAALGPKDGRSFVRVAKLPGSDVSRFPGMEGVGLAVLQARLNQSPTPSEVEAWATAKLGKLKWEQDAGALERLLDPNYVSDLRKDLAEASAIACNSRLNDPRVQRKRSDFDPLAIERTPWAPGAIPWEGVRTSVIASDLKQSPQSLIRRTLLASLGLTSHVSAYFQNMSVGMMRGELLDGAESAVRQAASEQLSDWMMDDTESLVRRVERMSNVANGLLGLARWDNEVKAMVRDTKTNLIGPWFLASRLLDQSDGPKLSALDPAEVAPLIKPLKERLGSDEGSGLLYCAIHAAKSPFTERPASTFPLRESVRSLCGGLSSELEEVILAVHGTLADVLLRAYHLLSCSADDKCASAIHQSIVTQKKGLAQSLFSRSGMDSDAPSLVGNLAYVMAGWLADTKALLAEAGPKTKGGASASYAAMLATLIRLLNAGNQLGELGALIDLASKARASMADQWLPLSRNKQLQACRGLIGFQQTVLAATSNIGARLESHSFQLSESGSCKGILEYIPRDEQGRVRRLKWYGRDASHFDMVPLPGTYCTAMPVSHWTRLFNSCHCRGGSLACE